MVLKSKTINIFEYSDYRVFLKDHYESCRKHNHEFTYRYIAEHVGFKSAGHFTQILKGLINLSVSMTASFAKFLNLGKKEAEYFRLLVSFNQAKTHLDKKQCFERILKFKALKIVAIAPEQYEYFDKWYYVAVREMLAYYPFSGNYAELSKKLKPSISPAEAKQAIDLLLRLALIKQDHEGIYRKVDPAITADPLGKSIAITNQALDTMKLAAESIDRFPREERNISGVAFSVSRGTYQAIQEEIRNFRKRVMDLAVADTEPDNVYQFNVQLFPLTEIREKRTQRDFSCD